LATFSAFFSWRACRDGGAEHGPCARLAGGSGGGDSRDEDEGQGKAGAAIAGDEALPEAPQGKLSLMMAERRALVALLEAAQAGRAEDLDALVKAQAAARNVSAGEVLREFKDGKGRTALHLAAGAGHVRVVEAVVTVRRRLRGRAPGGLRSAAAAGWGRVAVAMEGCAVPRCRSTGWESAGDVHSAGGRGVAARVGSQPCGTGR
jgi:hypothetical protein